MTRDLFEACELHTCARCMVGQSLDFKFHFGWSSQILMPLVVQQSSGINSSSSSTNSHARTPSYLLHSVHFHTPTVTLHYKLHKHPYSWCPRSHPCRQTINHRATPSYTCRQLSRERACHHQHDCKPSHPLGQATAAPNEPLPLTPGPKPRLVAWSKCHLLSSLTACNSRNHSAMGH